MMRLINSSNDDVVEEDPFCMDRSWVAQHCNRKGHEFFCRVPEEFMQDNFNLTGLSERVPNYEVALKRLLGPKYRPNTGDRSSRTMAVIPADLIDRSAQMLYGLIHSRYVMTMEGVAAVLSKFLNRDYGVCPRVYCNNTQMLPIGLSDNVDDATVKVYCPRCNDVYEPRSSRHHVLDGAFFGTGLPHMFFMIHPEMRPQAPTAQYDARLYGFKLYKLEPRTIV